MKNKLKKFSIKDRIRIKQNEDAMASNAFRFGNENKNSRKAKSKKANYASNILRDKDLMAFKSHFVRSPETFVYKGKSDKREKIRYAQLRHLFGKYPVPPVLDEAFDFKHFAHNNRGRFYQNDKNINFSEWYVCVSTGGSLYKKITKGFLTKRETHEFLKVPGCYNPSQAIVFAVAKCAGANDKNAHILAKSKISTADLKSEVWLDLIRFFSGENKTPKSIQEMNDLLDYFFFVQQQGVEIRIFGAGHSLESITRRMHLWHQELNRKKALSGYSWCGAPINDFLYDDKEYQTKWSITQIVTGEELADEGSAMNHCVNSYLEDCLAGYTSIWSLKGMHEGAQEPKRYLTIELNDNFDICQIRGYANRLPRQKELEIIKKWAAIDDLKIVEVY